MIPRVKHTLNNQRVGFYEQGKCNLTKTELAEAIVHQSITKIQHALRTIIIL